MSLVVTKNIKDLFKTRGVKTSQEAIEAIDRELKKLCLKAADNVLADKLKIIKALHVPHIDALLDTSSKKL